MGTATWNGTGDWTNNPGDWSGGTGSSGIPGYQNVLVNSGTNTIAAGETASTSLPGITVGSGSTAATLLIDGSLTGVNGTQINNNGTITVAAGGIYIGSNGGATIAAGGVFNVNGAVKISGTGITDNGTLTLSNTGSLTGPSLTIGTSGSFTPSGGTVNISGNITVNGAFSVPSGTSISLGTGLIVNAGARVTIQGNLVPGSTGISGAGTVTINGGKVGSAAAPLDLAGTNNIIIENGGSVYVNNENPPGSITFGAGNNNTVVFTNYIGTLTTPITGFAPGDTIQFNNAANSGTGGTTLTSNGNGTYTVNVTGSNVVLSDVTLAPGVTPAEVSAAPGTGGYDIGGCFLTGTLISTPAGELAVESLQVGDTVTTSQSGSLISKKIKWIGFRSIKPGELAGDEAHPVRVKADAFADSIPARDLLITGEHCILVDGGLIPVRMLVNGRSIITDTSISSFTYYHVELEEHSILLAEGVEVESYLDTGNRSDFANARVAQLKLQFGLPAHNGATPIVPLMVEPDAVKPVWERLNMRAVAQRFSRVQQAVSLTDDAEIRLVTSTGAVILPQLVDGKAIFALPAHATGLALASRTSRPCDVVGRYVDDRRELGLSVGAITLKTGNNEISEHSHFGNETLAGWHRPEGANYRWTSGMASLPASIATNGEAAMLEIEILRAGPYLVLAKENAAIAA